MTKPIITPPPSDLPQRGQPYESTFIPRRDALLAYHPVLDDNLSETVDYVRDQTSLVYDEHSRALNSADTSASSEAQAAQAVTSATAKRVEAGQYADLAESDAVAAESIIRYKGEWIDASGSGVAGDGYGFNGAMWILKQSVPDISLYEPKDGPVWVKATRVSASEIEIGQPIFSFAPLDEFHPEMYVRPGMVYMQEDYPELFEVIGVGSGVPPFDPMTEFYVPPVDPRGEVLFNQWASFKKASPYIVARVMPSDWSFVAMYNAGESGFLWDGLPYYQDPAGTTVASWGNPVGLISDDSGNSSDFTQATVTARPVLGRVPKGGRRNQVRNTDLSSAAWLKHNITLGDSLPFGSSTLVRVSRASGTDNAALNHQSIPTPLSSVVTVSCVCKVTETEGNGLFAISIRKGYPARADAVFDLITGEVTYGQAVPGFVFISTTITDLGDDTYRLSLTAVASGSGNESTSYMLGPASRSGGAWEGASDSTGEFYVGEVQYEYGDILTPYQAVTSQYDITESGVDSVEYLHLDGVDDSISTTLPAITNGTLVLAGTNGIWIDDDFNHAGGAFSIGPTTYTGGPEGILSVVGDLIVGGSFAIDRQLTTQERERVINKLKSMGAPGVFEWSDNLLINPEFTTDLSSWTQSDVNPAWTWDNGSARCTSTDYNVLWQSVAPIGTFVKVDLSVSDPGSYGALGISLNNGGLSQIYTYSSLAGNPRRTHTGTLSINQTFYIVSSGTGWNGAVDSVHVRKLELIP